MERLHPAADAEEEVAAEMVKAFKKKYHLK